MNSNTSLSKRLMKEYYEMRIDPPPHCYATPTTAHSKLGTPHDKSSSNNDNQAIESLNLMEWQGYIKGISGTPYENGTFKLSLSFSQDYPFKPPTIRFKTKIYHCNINHKGNICLDLLKDNWTPSLTTAKVLLSISQLLADPNPEDPLVQSIATELINDKKSHDAKAREWTKKYAIVGDDM